MITNFYLLPIPMDFAPLPRSHEARQIFP